MSFGGLRRSLTLSGANRTSGAIRSGLSPLIYVSALLTLLVPAAQAQKGYDFYSRGPYRSEVPRPSAILGYEAGKTHTTFRDQERVIQAIAAAAKDRIRIVDYGKSVEGRPLRLVVVTSPGNASKLDAIRAKIAKLADPRTVPPSQTDEIVKSTPAIVWINHCIHGDETASFEAFMWTLYTLAASQSPQILDTLAQVVVVLNPVFNPDGHERFVTYYNSIAVGSPEQFAFEHRVPWGASGRGNHYRFDMNRDKLMQSQPETRQESAAFLQWNPQVYADQHGQPEMYFFPPTSRSVNTNADRARMEKWTTVFGKSNAAAFDKHGWTYVTRETYDFFSPFYLDTWSALSGAVGMTYETDGGGSIARRRSDETISTLRDAMAHHFETALSTIVTAAANREGLLRDYATYRREAIRAGETGKLRAVVFPAGGDPGRLAELAATLMRSGIEVREAKAAFRSTQAHTYIPKKTDNKAGAAQLPAETVEFPAGSLIVDLAQPQGHVAAAYLTPETDFEPEFVKEQMARKEANEKKNENEPKEGYDFYDTTAWAPPFLYEVPAYWTSDLPSADARTLKPDKDGSVQLSSRSGGVTGGRAAVAYLFKYDRDAGAQLACRLLNEGYRLAFANKPTRAGGKEWPRGTLIVRVARNPESLHAHIEALSKELGVDVTALNSAYSDESQIGINSDSVENVRPARIAVIADDTVDITEYGALWYLLERFAGLEFTPMRLRSIQSADLSRFNIIIFPPGFGYGGLGKAGIDKLKAWASGGNVLIGLGPGALWMTEKDNGISTATIVGADAPADQKPPETKPGDQKPAEKKPKKPVALPGAIFRATLDPTHFLAYGYGGEEIAVPLAGATFLKPSTKGSNVVKFGKAPLKLSGFEWEGNTEELLADTAYVIDEPFGSGHAIIYLMDPTARAMWPGLRRLFLSAILFGPRRTPLVTLGAE